ncbi:hypothetical protein [Streptomyces sp. NPDC058664]|uniref:hypothetical protein n=1 Tax=unclassified Streptomyces TaxID=2593676 RepID=UPI0036689866
MAIRRISLSVISGILLMGGISATTPASAADTPVGADGPRRVTIEPGYMKWVEWRCHVGSQMSEFSITGGPYTHLGAQQAFPENEWAGPGVGLDIINLSNTSYSWYEVSYNCSEPLPIKVKKIFDIPSSGIVERSLGCPSGYPWIGAGTGRQISGLNGSISIQSYEVYPPDSEGAGYGTFKVKNSSRIGGEVELTVTCHSKEF